MEPRVFLEENAVEGMKGDTVVEEDIYSILMKKKNLHLLLWFNWNRIFKNV